MVPCRVLPEAGVEHSLATCQEPIRIRRLNFSPCGGQIRQAAVRPRCGAVTFWVFPLSLLTIEAEGGGGSPGRSPRGSAGCLMFDFILPSACEVVQVV